jgi:hypothetical protein
MKYRLLLLAAALTVAAWPPAISSAEVCPFFPCSAFINECEGLNGTVTLTYVAACTGYGSGYAVYNALCEIPPAEFYDDTCRQ